ncbi:hypothetical protein [Rossellomorea marisflavi]|uniref:hypothetical protein n=1 Tax=Rossellomorea marisflavi TaxID=189381 RepID=UPI003511ECC9
MIKVLIISTLLCCLIINYLLIKKLHKIFSFYIETFPRFSQIELTHELEVGNRVDLSQIKKNLKMQNENYITLLFVSPSCQTCKGIIRNIDVAEKYTGNLIIISNGKLLEEHKKLLETKKINLIESENFFKSFNVRSVPKILEVKHEMVTQIHNVYSIKDFEDFFKDSVA